MSIAKIDPGPTLACLFGSIVGYRVRVSVFSVINRNRRSLPCDHRILCRVRVVKTARIGIAIDQKNDDIWWGILPCTLRDLKCKSCMFSYSFIDHKYDCEQRGLCPPRRGEGGIRIQISNESCWTRELARWCLNWPTRCDVSAVMKVRVGSGRSYRRSWHHRPAVHWYCAVLRPEIQLRTSPGSRTTNYLSTDTWAL